MDICQKLKLKSHTFNESYKQLFSSHRMFQFTTKFSFFINWNIPLISSTTLPLPSNHGISHPTHATHPTTQPTHWTFGLTRSPTICPTTLPPVKPCNIKPYIQTTNERFCFLFFLFLFLFFYSSWFMYSKCSNRNFSK